MFDNRPIGVFDSGLGGLTITSEIEKKLPHESIIYVGDTARVPYGNRSPETITDFSREIVNFLKKQQVKAIVIACATASSAAAEIIRQENPDIPIYDMITPFKAGLDGVGQRSLIGVIGTRATINSGLLVRTIGATHPQAIIESKACPLFVPIIEEGIISGPILDQTISLYLTDWQRLKPSHLVLGCTHYPMIADHLKRYFPATKIVHPGQLLADLLKTEIAGGQLLASKASQTHRYFITDMNDSFKKMACPFLGRPIEVQKVNLTGPLLE